MFTDVVFCFLLLCGTAAAAANCAGTKFGCCPDQKTQSTNPEDVGCPKEAVRSTPQCVSFIKDLVVDCSTRTSCREFDCFANIMGLTAEMDIALHRCSDPVSANATVRFPGREFSWNHLFSRSSLVQIPNLISVTGFVSAWIFVNVTRNTEGQIIITALIRPRIFQLPMSDIILMENALVPVDTSDCSAVKPPQTCSPFVSGAKCEGSGMCVWALDGGVICYLCPEPGSCSGKSTSPVCGDNGVTYSNDCFMRQDACAKFTEINVLKRGPCDGSDRGTQPPPVEHLPLELASLKEKDRPFFEKYVITMKMKTTNKIRFSRAYLESRLQNVLGFKLVIMDATYSTEHMTVTLYGYHFHSEGGLLVLGSDLLAKVTSSSAEIKRAFGGILEIETEAFSLPEENGVPTMTIVIAVACSVGGVLILVALVGISVWFWRKRSVTVTSVSPDDVAYLPKHDEITMQQKST